MLKKTSKFIAVFITALVLVVPVFATGSADKEKDSSIKLSLATPDNTYGLSSDSELQQEITNIIKEKTGYDIEPIIPPLSSYTDKLTTLINSGDVPDLFAVAQAMVKIPQLASREQILDLTDYIKNSKELSIVNPSFFSTPTVNGKIYFVPYNNPKSKGLFLRKDIMEKYNIKLSSTPTTDEFMKEMKKLIGTGIQPFTFPKWVDNLQFFYNSFGAWGGVYKDGNKFIDGFQSPEMKEALAYIHELYAAGIFNKEFITTENSQMREKTYTAKSAADIDYITNYINYVQNTEKAGKPTEMHIIYKLIGPKGKGGALNEATQTAWCISSKTKNPEAAFKTIEAIVTDSVLYPAFYGIGLEGKHFTLNEKGEISPTQKASNSGYKYTLNYLSDSFINFDINSLSFKLPPTLSNGIKVQREKIKEAANHLGPNHSADVPVGLSDAYDRVSPSIKSTRESIATKIVLGSVTVEEGMSEYANFWKSINGDQILAELNK